MLNEFIIIIKAFNALNSTHFIKFFIDRNYKYIKENKVIYNA